MLRGLHTKLVLIMILLVVCLMGIAGAFLVNSVSRFYISEFYVQMADVFGNDTEFVRDLLTQTEGETDGAQALRQVLAANMGALGVDGHSRNYYVLDGETGACLAGSDDRETVAMTPNILTALSEKTEGTESDMTASYMDLAVPVTRGGEDYIVYILDNKATTRQLNSQVLRLIMEALVFGLVISGLLSLMLSRALVTPIGALTEGARKVAEGDFGHEIKVDSDDEIGVLTDAFNNMAGQLRSMLWEVENEKTKLSTLFLHMTDGVVAFNRAGEVIHSNPAAEEMLDMAVPEGGAVGYADLFEDVAPLESVLALESDCLDSELTRGDRYLLLLLAPFDREKQQGGVLAVIHDITQQVKNEETRKEFVANVSHELRTPLTNIRSYAETLADNPDLPPEMAQSFLGVILNESDRMAHIVQDLLTLSRFDSGRDTLSLTEFHFGEMLRECYRAVEMEAKRHGHTFTLKGADNLPAVSADRERIQQVVLNILSNAIKYTPEQGTIRMTAGFGRGRVWLEVADNGIGIPQADRARIFERFYRVDKARSRESGGTGLGLSIAKEIVDRHEGVLRLVDRSGPGITVRLELKTGGPAQ